MRIAQYHIVWILSICAIALQFKIDPVYAEVKPNSIFSDNAVFQRGIAIPVYGTAKEGEEITVQFAGQEVSTVAQGGKWRVLLQPMQANALPQTMTFRGENAVEIGNVLVGDVWVASGQSNMERQLGLREGQKPIENWQAEAAKADYPQIRQYYVPEHLSLTRQTDANGKWTVCTPQTAPDFCAVGFFFARDVHQAEKIPVGILFSAWGGTPAEAWTSEEALKTMPVFRSMLETMRTQAGNPNMHAEQVAKWYADNDPGSAKTNDWSAASLPEEDWKAVEMPAQFPGDFDGVIWYRKELDLPESWNGKAAVMRLCAIDDQDTTWVNGVQIGSMDIWNAPREYHIPEGVMKSGRNAIAIRVLDTGGPGGFFGKAEQMSLELAGDKSAVPVSLAGQWHSRTGVSLSKTPRFPVRADNNPNAPTVLYNAMLAPLQSFPIKGAIWYQGESNSDRPRQYLELFPLMIADWRRAWDVRDFPFLFVQIAPHVGMVPEIREVQFRTLAKTSNTAMAVTTDIGDANDIHPARKGPVGIRLALAARTLAYGEKIEYSGPLFESMKVEGNKALISFAHAGGGLVAKDGELKGFTIARVDKKFVPAKAEIKGNTIVVWSDEITSPVAVRYGWSNVPEVNLFNREGLPASPFRTDFEQ
ncbi:MAG: sialate O-acetylesterase [Thermoguttaceae bacterium]|jgi:sialate O-acetylesterase